MDKCWVGDKEELEKAKVDETYTSVELGVRSGPKVRLGDYLVVGAVAGALVLVYLLCVVLRGGRVAGADVACAATLERRAIGQSGVGKWEVGLGAEGCCVCVISWECACWEG